MAPYSYRRLWSAARATGAAMGCEHRAPARSVVQVLQAHQGFNEFLIVAPASDRVLVDFLSHLPGAGSGYATIGLVVIQTAVIPLKTDELQHLGCPGCLIRDQSLVRDIQNGSG